MSRVRILLPLPESLNGRLFRLFLLSQHSLFYLEVSFLFCFLENICCSDWQKFLDLSRPIKYSKRILSLFLATSVYPDFCGKVRNYDFRADKEHSTGPVTA